MERTRTTPVPILTAAVFGLTAAVSVAGLIAEPIMIALRRDGAALSDGELWRLVTSMLAQDGGIAGTAVNLAGLAVLGVLVERRAGRGWWITGYLGAGLIGQLAGWAGWQPIGAGNSVAVCGLAGVLALDLLAHPDRDRTAPLAIAFWSAAVLGSGFGSVVVPVVVCAAAAGLVNLAAARPTALTPGRVAAGTAVVSTVVLLVRWDIHGAAMAAGLVIGGARLLAFPALGPADRPAGRG